ncbi:MAG: tetratricopeptide repeat protein [Desulfobaccales bacterium]
MDILESFLELAQKNLLPILTCLWFIWCAGVALGIIICNVSIFINRRTLAILRRRYESHRLKPDEEAAPFEFDPAHLQNILICREKELRDDGERMGLDFGLQAVLEHFRARIQKKLADPPATHQELIKRLQGLYQALEELKDLFEPEQFFLARMALKRGETGKAKVLLKQAQARVYQPVAGASSPQLTEARGKRLAAQAAFLLGAVEETNFDFFAATQYYLQAADLQPTNLTYLNAAAEFSYAFGEFHETEHLLKQVLRIQEKLQGPEHPALAQTLNNLGVLRHTQGQHAEAEAFYLWALEICEAHLNPEDPDVVSLMQNYAGFLQEIGRNREAASIKARAAMH